MEVPEGLELVDYGGDAAILIYGLSGEAVRAAQAVGLRVAAELPLERFLAADAEPAHQATVIALDRDRGPETDRLLDRVTAAAAFGGERFVLTMPVALVDLAARISDRRVALLVDPDAAELGAALAIAATARERPRLDDVSRDAGAIRLIELTEEVGRIARRLAALSDGVSGQVSAPSLAFAAPPPMVERPAAAADPPTSAAAIRALIRRRRLRDQHLGDGFFADPAWDILLDLAAARKEARAVAVSSLCIAAAVPPTTALRWIGRLEEEGMIVRSADPKDGRRMFIAIADRAAAAMDAWLEAAARIG